MGEIEPEDIVAFWQGAGRERWFAKDEAFDAEATRRFGEVRALAQSGALDGWRHTAIGTLALVLLLDQFPRNMFRGSPRAFATDEQARQVADGAIAAGFDRQVPSELRAFFYLPFMHSEDVDDQERCVALYEAAGDVNGLKWAREHRDIVARFGRFPHRNALLGRETTADEAGFLAGGGFKG